MKIAQRLRPFCHLPGTRCLVPNTEWEVQVFPALLRFKNLVTEDEMELSLNVQGPVRDFTVEVDLEKGAVKVYGKNFRELVISRGEEGIVISKTTLPVTFLPCATGNERLSLGMHKSLDWELVKRRGDLKEIFPVWLCMAQMVPDVELPNVGAAKLLKECGKMEAVDEFLKLFLAGFHGILVPRLFDDDYQGIVSDEQVGSVCPLGLLKEGAKLIRSLFFQEKKNSLALLPELPPDFHAGRFMHIMTSHGDRIDMEWSKKLLRSVVLHPAKDREVRLELQKALKSFRKNKGKRIAAGDVLSLRKGETVFLDRFEK